jgi:type II secretory ATPase GspE/PulE/Tfp pilus assembly ATPase PilB-like protein/tetratricopeptide (TPR) repeat protein
MRSCPIIFTGWAVFFFSSAALAEPVTLYFGATSRFVGEVIFESTSEDLIRLQLESGAVMSLPLCSVTRRLSGEFVNEYVRASRLARQGKWVEAVEVYVRAAEGSPDTQFAESTLREARDQLLDNLPHLDQLESCSEVERIHRLADMWDTETATRIRGAVSEWYRVRFIQWKAAADQAEVREDYRAAILYYSKGLRCATDYLERQTIFADGLARVYIKEGYRLYHWGGDHDVVVDHIRAAIEAAPRYEQAHLLKAEVFCTRAEELLNRWDQSVQKGKVPAESLIDDASAAFREAADAMITLDKLGGIPLGTRNHIYARVLEIHDRLKARKQSSARPVKRLEDMAPASFTGRIRFYTKKGWNSVSSAVLQQDFWHRVLGWIGDHWMPLFVGFPVPIIGGILLDRDMRSRGTLKGKTLGISRAAMAAYCCVLLFIGWGLGNPIEMVPFLIACGVPVLLYGVYARFLYHPTGICSSCGAQILDYEEYEDLDFSRCPQCRAPLETRLSLLGYIRHVARTIEQPALLEGRKMTSEGSFRQRDRMALLIRLLVTHALRRRASDIHVELDRVVKGKQDLGIKSRIRLRIDGILFYEVDFSEVIHSQLISAVKNMAEMDIADRLHPQDGHCHMIVDGSDIHIRVSTSPTSTGQKMVLRLLDRRQVMRPPSELGLQSLSLIEFENAIHSPQGIVLATGPSGSGKTTLLYSAICTLLDGEKSIVSIEDPIEYDIPGINQIQHDPKVGVTFSSALRNILRQDPDIIMVGEMRDAETTKMAIEAAKTGHLVFSTLHTTDACMAASRLIDLGASPQDVGAALKAVVAQRLVRVICPYCKTETGLSAQETEMLLKELGHADIKVWEGTGCAACRGTGYLGRTGLFEILAVSEEIRELIAERAPLAKIRAMAASAGMKTLWDDGMLKISDGITTLKEVRRVTQPVREGAPARPV